MRRPDPDLVALLSKAWRRKDLKVDYDTETKRVMVLAGGIHRWAGDRGHLLYMLAESERPTAKELSR